MNYGLDPAQFVRHVLRPTLTRLQLGLPAAETLILGTGLVESELRYVDQIDKANKPGPAFGLFQCEGLTHSSYWQDYLRYQPDLKLQCIRLATWFSGDFPDPREMSFNLAYSVAMCRVHYRRLKASLPPANDAMALALFHKQHYNTVRGATKVDESLKHFEFAIQLIGAIT
jgi:hypothetical protein